MSLSICAVFRNEAPYLREWIEFHRIVGVEKFFLFNNRSEDDYKSVLTPYIESGLVELTRWPHLVYYTDPKTGKKLCAQEQAFQATLAKVKDTSGWIAFIDIDEFLFSPRYPTIIEALSGLPQAWSAVGVSWMCFGASDETDWRDTPTIERFTWRPNEPNEWNVWYKTIMRLPSNGAVCTSSHTFKTAGGTFLEDGTQLLDGITPVPNHPPKSSLLRINHYFTKSRPEWEKRHPANPGMNAWARNENRWGSLQIRDVDDRTIQKWLPELRKRLKISIQRAKGIQGWMGDGELQYLAEMANRSKIVVEIGSWMGRSTCAMATSTYGKVYAVDTWKGAAGDAEHAKLLAGKPEGWLLQQFKANTAGLDNIEIMQMSSVEAADALWKTGVKADLVFIDAGHTEAEVKQDIRSWRSHLAEGGILCGHDFADYCPGVKKAVTDLVPKFRVVPGTTIWSTEGA